MEVMLFVGVWMGLGWSLHLDVNAYLILGLPLTLVFQRLVRRQPIQALWVRDASRFQLDGVGVLIALLLAATPAWAFTRSWHGHDWGQLCWYVCAAAGALPAAFTLRSLGAGAVRLLFQCLLWAGLPSLLLQVGIHILVVHARHGIAHDASVSLWLLVQQFLLLFPVCFVLEEVTFRSLLDTHMHRPGDGRPWLSAWFLSALWGLGHLPVTPAGAPFLARALVLALVMSVVGIPLSLYWRRSGNLVVTALPHALLDAVRNALMAAS